MNLFDTKDPFSLKIYFSENNWNQSEDSTIIPVFYEFPKKQIKHSFGLCVFNTEDITAAQAIFHKTSSNSEYSHFLYLPGDICRQTDILNFASETGFPLFIEKGCFLSPDDIKRMVAKITHKNFALIECGSSFGYADRVLDPRSLMAMKEVSPNFGVCLTDLMAPSEENYPHRATWISDKKFMDAFKLAAQNFGPRFFVYKDVNITSKNKSTHSDELQNTEPSISKPSFANKSTDKKYPGGWDGHIANDVYLNSKKLTIIAGPCMLESLELGLEVGRYLKNLCQEFGFNYVFKSSFDKANRTSAGGIRGPGLEQGIEWLSQIKKELNVPVLTDVHDVHQAKRVSEVVDILQIPAFLFREKDLLKACAETGKVMQIKKGQWASAQDMLDICSYLTSLNFHKVILAERGTCFGYNNLSVDFRNLVDMGEFGNAVVFDATHAVQLPGAKNGKSSGLRYMVPALTRAALAVGIDGLFMEVHPNPDCALSDADTQLSFEMAKEIFASIK